MPLTRFAPKGPPNEPSTARWLRPLAGIALALSLGLGLMLGLTPASAAPQEKIRIAVEGDSMGDGIWEGLARLITRTPCLQSSVTLQRFSKVSTGLTRLDRFNWPAEAARIDKSFRPDLVIISIGLNDRQGAVDAQRRVAAWGTEEWPKKYAEHATWLLEAAAPARAGVLWIGISSIRDPAVNADVKAKNKLFADVVARAGQPKLAFVPPWRLDPKAEDDPYRSTGPDLHGRIVQLRTTDGEHFTSSGYDLLAAYLNPIIIAHLKQQGLTLPDACMNQRSEDVSATR